MAKGDRDDPGEAIKVGVMPKADMAEAGVTGEPCAMKVASTVRRGAAGKGLQ
jgi:hypothetical protein